MAILTSNDLGSFFDSRLFKGCGILIRYPWQMHDEITYQAIIDLWELEKLKDPDMCCLSKPYIPVDHSNRALNIVLY